ncbi:hypothetical protein DL770_003294 [Monosporascus sp. CRB-9-2]|nr:hypothetical protein DL770_003294 [Monosporascus sp. CRB-9-2]
MAPQVLGLSEMHGTMANFWEDAKSNADNLLSLLDRSAAPDVKIHIVGQEFQLARDLDSLQALKDYFQATLLPAFLGSLDTTKPMSHEHVSLISGADGEWHAMEMKGTATAKNGKPWVNETLLVVRSNSEGRWVEVKVYMDTLHLQNHLLQASK